MGKTLSKPQARKQEVPLQVVQRGQAAGANQAAKPAQQGDDGAVRARIAEVAYSLWEARGRQGGHDVEDWLAAERKVRYGQ